MAGPLDGVRILEFSGLGPAPFAAMLLAELGADVVKVDRKQAPGNAGGGRNPGGRNFGLDRSKRSIALDLRDEADLETARRLAARAEILIEGFRPGVMERMGLGPDVLLTINPGLVYGRMTGWGQDGPLARTAGHDLNYAGLTGALWGTGRKDDPPAPPLNLVADFGGGSLYLVMGVLAALTHARRTGEGQVVDAAMIDGAASLVGLIYSLRAVGLWQDKRQANLLDGGVPWYDTYACADGGYVAVAALEPEFWEAFIERSGLDPGLLRRREDREAWPAVRHELKAFFGTLTRDEACARFEGSDACVSPVLSWAEAPTHPHNLARQTFDVRSGHALAGPAPRFSLTPARIVGDPPAVDADRQAVLRDWDAGPPATSPPESAA